MNTEKLFTKDFIILFIINFFAIMQFFLGIVALPPYAIQTFHTSEGIAGLISSIYIIGALIGRFVGGSIIEDFGNKRILIISSIFYFVTSALYLSEAGLTLLLINRILNGIAYGIVATTAATIIAQIIPVSRQGEGISYYGLSTIIAMAGGPFLAIILIQYTDFHTVFLCNVIFAAIGLVLSFTKMQQVQIIANQVQKNNLKRFNISNYIEIKVIPIASIALIVALAYSSVITFLSLYAVQLHLEKASSYYFLICSIVILFTRPMSGRLFDAKGANIIIYPSLIALAIGMFIYAQVSHAITLFLSSLFFGLGWGNFHSSAQSLAIKLTPSNRYGIATATYFIFYEIGMGLGPYFCGYLVQFIGYRNLYSIMGSVVIAVIVLYYFLQGIEQKTICD